MIYHVSVFPPWSILIFYSHDIQTIVTNYRNRNYFQALHLHAIKAKSPFGHQIIIIQSGMSTFRRPVHELNPLESMDIGRKLCGKEISNQTFRFSSRYKYDISPYLKYFFNISDLPLRLYEA